MNIKKFIDDIITYFSNNIDILLYLKMIEKKVGVEELKKAKWEQFNEIEGIISVKNKNNKENLKYFL